MTGMFHGLRKHGGLGFTFAFPIIDRHRMKDGEAQGCRYYSFSNDTGESQEVSGKRVDRFKEILCREEPDVIHIWGTEFPWALEMVLACEALGLLNRTVINIQGLAAACELHYLSGIPDLYRKKRCGGYPALEEERDAFGVKGRNETGALKKVRHVCGRTDWDRAWVRTINPGLKYHFCNAILRDEFYLNAGTWDINRCERNRIFVGQAAYPIKGVHYLFQAVAYLAEEFPGIKVCIGGNNIIERKKDHPYAVFLSDEIKRLGICDNIEFIGKMDEREMLKQYRMSHVFVSPSVVENESNSVLEAMMVGLPVVSSYVGGIPTYMTHKVNGLMYPETEPVMLADCIRSYLTDDRLCMRISEEGRKTAEKTVDRDKAVRALTSLYDELAAST